MKAKLCSIFLCCGFLFSSVIVGNIETYYQSKMVVTEVNAITHTVTAVDNNGNLWSYTVEENDIPPYEGKEIICIMHNNHTSMIYDDIIVKVNYK